MAAFLWTNNIFENWLIFGWTMNGWTTWIVQRNDLFLKQMKNTIVHELLKNYQFFTERTYFSFSEKTNETDGKLMIILRTNNINLFFWTIEKLTKWVVDKWWTNEMKKSGTRPSLYIEYVSIFRNFMNYDVQDGEYTCPICERLSNTVLPVLPPLSSLRLEMKTYCFWKKKKIKNIKNQFCLF